MNRKLIRNTTSLIPIYTRTYFSLSFQITPEVIPANNRNYSFFLHNLFHFTPLKEVKNQ